MFSRNAFLLGWRELIIISWCLTVKQLKCDDQRRWSDKGPRQWGLGEGHTRPTCGTGTLCGLINEGVLRGWCGQTFRGHGDAPLFQLFSSQILRCYNLGACTYGGLPLINKVACIMHEWYSENLQPLTLKGAFEEGSQSCKCNHNPVSGNLLHLQL